MVSFNSEVSKLGTSTFGAGAKANTTSTLN
jgi:hypothetical protein